MSSVPKLQKVRGTQDLLPETTKVFRYLDRTAWSLAERYGFNEIETPIFEFTEVFHRTLGETSDVIHKETYTFIDRSGDSLTLRPEGTAGIARAFISEGLSQNLPLRFYYFGPMFRHERPQKGRYRQFHQIGVEALGLANPQTDVDCISLGWDFLKTLQLTSDCLLEINTLGDAESRIAYREKLVEYFSRYKSDLSADSQLRLQKNPLRILDSKDSKDREICQTAPSMQQFLNFDSQKFFAQVLEGLSFLSIPFQQSSSLVRGLDYYNHTVFEITTQKLGAQGTLLAGGRYDGLIETMGGPATPGFGWAAGVERLAELLNPLLLPKSSILAVLIPADETGEKQALIWAQLLREKMRTEILWNGNVGKRMKKANSMNAEHVFILGETECKAQSIMWKNMKTGEQKLLTEKSLAVQFNTL